MNEIKCPHCGKEFPIDEAAYNSIAKQVRDIEFAAEVDAQRNAAVALAEAKKDKQIVELENRLKASAAERELAVRAAVDKQQAALSEKEQEISVLRAKIEDMERLAAADKDAAVNEIRMKANKKFSELQDQINRADADRALAVQSVMAEKEQAQHQHELQIMELNSRMAAMENDFKLKRQQAADQNALILKQKDEEIAYYKDYKSRQSTKMLGETLEQHCEIAFNQIRPSAFPGAYFEKDNDASLGTKGDYIFRDFDEHGEEYISIMFDMKNEADETATKHKNEDFLKKLDKDRQDKGCEYAVLVSTLESNSELYNTGIVDMSHRYPKMYVVRPQFFVALICLLRDASRSCLAYRHELTILKQQYLEVEMFMNRLKTFKDGFAKNVQQASDRFAAAIKEIDTSIERLQKAKAALLLSEKHLDQANGKVEDLTIKRLTKGAPALAKEFLAVSGAEGGD